MPKTLTEKAADLLAYIDKNAKPPVPEGRPTVADMLEQSRAQHQVYRRSLRHRANGVTVDGDPKAAAEAVSASARLRAQAEITDPKHEARAWADDMAAKFPHEALVEFYDAEVKYYVPAIPDAKPPDEPPPTDPKLQEALNLGAVAVTSARKPRKTKAKTA